MKTALLLPFKLLLACGLALIIPAAYSADGAGGVGVQHLSLIDESRPVKASSGFAGSSIRRIDVTLWYPADIQQGDSVENAAPASGPVRPLIIWSHGSYGRADNNMHLVNHLVRAGYIVAGPDYPLSSRAAYTKITAIDLTDVVNQTGDVRFIIDELLTDKDLSSLIDKGRIATMGHSLGAVTSYFTSFGSGVRDPRIKATVLLGAGDPVQAALATDMGLTGTWHVPAPVPVLFLSGEYDPFALINGRPHSAYARLEKPKYEIMIKGGVHIWFRDGNNQPADGSNPDCAMLAGFRPGVVLPGCEPGARLTTPLRQQEITRIAVRDFLDGYLKGDTARLEDLRSLPANMPEVELLFEE